MHTVALALVLAVQAPSVTTMAAVAVFAANVDRQWPTDDREPVVTSEALGLMTAAAQALADDGHVTDGKVKDAIGRVNALRDELMAQASDDQRRPEQVRDALKAGSDMIERLTKALHHEDGEMKRRLSGIERSAGSFDKKQPVVKQVDVLERYFQQASEVLKTLLEAETPA